MKRRYLVCALCLLILGCSGNDGQEEEGVFDAQIHGLDGANAVEEQIMDAAARQKQALEDQE